MQCPVCDGDSAAGAVYCQHCGAKMPSSDGSSIEAPPEAVQQQQTPDPAKSASAPRRSGRYADIPEETLWEGTYSAKAMLGVFLLCGVLTIGLLVAALLLATTILFGAVLLSAIVVVWGAAAMTLSVRRLGISYKLTTHMFFHRRGLLNRVTDRIELIEIHDVTWSQGLLERMVGVGTITISSNDRTHPKLPLPGIENVESVADKIDKARRSEQVRRGRRIDFSHIDGQT